MLNYISEILKRKDLLIYLVKSGLKAENRNSYLGYFWWLLDPLLNVIVYYFLVVVILGRGGPDYPVFLVIGLVVWRWINTTVNASAKAITKYTSIINQVYLPKSIFPLSLSITQLFNFCFGLVVIAIFLAIFGYVPGWQLILLPVVILITLIFLIAISLFLSYITVFVRDIDNVLTHVMRLFFYASPIIWEGGRLQNSDLPEQFLVILNMNPVAILLNAYRDILMDQKVPQFLGLFVLTVLSILVIVYMLHHYNKNEHKIIKVL
ncbi:teichoic acid transport system permease protein [Gracilibacillus orientalis]|uniref:Transport permease protein n=1 Tax=Gracilibacillus orientalis TaxID=334253 RepID=A0A1I4PHR0_9BACI|nr:ABC transporter permease [Gracilibacillus orientalis]SFM27351.1 teichoic acid transport system permease protein [Gracilibacillus orientalis]